MSIVEKIKKFKVINKKGYLVGVIFFVFLFNYLLVELISDFFFFIPGSFEVSLLFGLFYLDFIKFFAFWLISLLILLSNNQEYFVDKISSNPVISIIFGFFWGIGFLIILNNFLLTIVLGAAAHVVKIIGLIESLFNLSFVIFSLWFLFCFLFSFINKSKEKKSESKISKNLVRTISLISKIIAIILIILVILELFLYLINI